MNWQTSRSCGKRKKFASSLFSRIHWRKPTPFCFFWTVRIQSRGKRSSIWFEWHLREMPKFAPLPVCIVLGLLQQTPWPMEKQTCSLSLASPSGAQDGIFLCIPWDTRRVAGPAGSMGMLYKTLQRLFLACSFREAKLIGVATLSVPLLSPTKDV